MQRIAVAARRDMVQLTILIRTNPTGYAVVHSEIVHVSMRIALLTDLDNCTSNSFGCPVDSTVSVCSCIVKIHGLSSYGYRLSEAGIIAWHVRSPRMATIVLLHRNDGIAAFGAAS